MRFTVEPYDNLYVVYDWKTGQVVGRSQGAVITYSKEGAESAARHLNNYERVK